MENAEYTSGKKLFDFKLIGIGLCFFIDFNMNTFDILPDFLGLVLIYAGIGKSAYIGEKLMEAKNYINYFFAASGVKLVWNIIYLVFGKKMFEAKILEDGLVSLLSLSFAVIELILSMGIFINIIKGIDTFFQASALPVSDKKPELVLTLLKIFFILKFILSFFVLVPELLTDVNLDELSMFFGMYLDGLIIKNMLVPPFFIVQGLLGIFVLSVAVPHFFKTAKDGELYEFIKSKINAASAGENFLALKQRLNPAFAFFAAGCVFFVDLRIDNINILPDFAICVLFLFGISIILKTNPELKNRKPAVYPAINLFISIISYILDLIYRFTAISSFTDKNVVPLRVLRISADVFFHVSVILFLLTFIEFYVFIRALQRKNLEFAERYLNKRFISSEKELDKNKSKIMTFAAFAFCAKTLSAVLPHSGIVMFYHSVILIAFASFLIKGLYFIRDSIYSYYN